MAEPPAAELDPFGPKGWPRWPRVPRMYGLPDRSVARCGARQSCRLARMAADSASVDSCTLRCAEFAFDGGLYGKSGQVPSACGSGDRFQRTAAALPLPPFAPV